MIRLVVLLAFLGGKPIPPPHPSVSSQIKVFPEQAPRVLVPKQISPVPLPSASVLSQREVSPLPRIELIAFGATWCTPCQFLKPMIRRLQMEGLPVYYNDVGQFPRMAKGYGVSAVPHWILRVDGKVVEERLGRDVSEKEIREWLRHAKEVGLGEGEWETSAVKTKRGGIRQLIPIVPAGDSHVRGRSSSYYWVQSN